MGYQRPILFAGLGMVVGAASVAIATAFLPADAAPTIRQAALTPPTTSAAMTATKSETPSEPSSVTVVTGPRSAPRAEHAPQSPAVQLASTLPEENLPTLRPREEVLTVQRGDTLMGILVEAGVAQTEAHESITALQSVYNPRNIRPGDEIILTFGPRADDADVESFQGFSLNPDPVRTVSTLRDDEDGGFTVQETTADTHEETRRFEGRIETSLFEAATEAGVPRRVLAAMVKTLSYDVDFQRDIRQGDTFGVMARREVTERGDGVGDPEILFLSMELSGERYAYYRFEDSDGFVDYYDAKGQSVRKALMRTPINGARLSSGFGKRKHPVLGFTKMHKGVDFAAPTGTPIYAAGDGVVERANRFGSYGNYIRVRHNPDWDTAYAHLSRFAKGIHAGKRVRQGQVIGYVGTTGRSTGAHLHYEVLKKNAQVNPMSVRFPAGRKLTGADLKRFAAIQARTEDLYASLPHSTTVASTD